MNVSSLAFAFIRSLSFSSGHWYTLEISYEQAPYGSNIHITVDTIVDIIIIHHQLPASNGEHLSCQLKRRYCEDASQSQALAVAVVQVVNLRQGSVPLQHDCPEVLVGKAFF